MAGILFGTIPILMVVLAPIFLAEETFTRRRLAGGVVGLAGVILLIGPSVLANASAQTLGIAITFLGPLSHTLGAIYARRQTNLTPPTMATGQMIFGGLILVPLAFATEAPLNLNPSMGVIGATRSSLVPMFMPVVAVVLGAVVLGERLPLSAFSGLALILAGALAVSSRAPAKPLVSVTPNVPEMQ